MSAAAASADRERGLRIEGLAVEFPASRADESPARAVDGIDLEVPAGRTLALVGESGCGKTLTACSVLRLLPKPGRVVAGRVLWKGADVLSFDGRRLRRLRGGEIAMVFQDAAAALDPVFTVGEQVAEVLRVHRGLSRGAARAAAVDELARAGLPRPERWAREVPHRLSGGMKQRAALAIALAGGPELLLADEPTTALDVSVQAQVLELLASVQEQEGIGILLVTHDLGVVAESANEVAVMYAGRIVERVGRDQLFREPLHPYTRGLLTSLPRLEGPLRALVPIAGQVPQPRERPSGCAFRTRCPLASERCLEEEPRLSAWNGSAVHELACHHPEGEGAR